MKTSKKCLRAASAFLCLLVMLAGAAAQAETYATVKGGMLNLRQTASLDAKVLGQYPTGTWISVLDQKDGWSHVTVNGKTGYMMSKFLSADEQSVMYVRTNTGVGLNLRTAPGMNGQIITSFRPDTPVTVLQRGSGWYYVAVEEQNGFMSSRFLRSASAAQPAEYGLARMINPNGGSIVNFRSSPSLSGKLICAYPVGTQVKVLQKLTDWVKVEINGQQGYVSAYFLK